MLLTFLINYTMLTLIFLQYEIKMLPIFFKFVLFFLKKQCKNTSNKNLLVFTTWFNRYLTIKKYI